MSGFARFPAFALIVLVFLAENFFRPEARATDAPQTVTAAAVRTPPSDARIWYGARNYPRLLSLPDGRQEIVRSVLNITAPMQFGDFVWDEERIPEGPVWVRIDLARQLLSVFRGGHEIGSAVILYGTDGKPTPTGSFTILEKDARPLLPQL